MGFGDSLSFITGGPTSNDKENKRVERERASWEREGGEDRNAAFRDMYTNPANPNYQGPGYEVFTHPDGRAGARLVDADANAQWKNQVQNPVPAPPAVVTDPNAALDELDMDAPAAPPAQPQTFQQRASAAGTNPYANTNPALSGLGGERADSALPVANDYLSNFDLEQGEPTAPTTNRENVDPLLRGIDSVQQQLLSLANETRGMSAAEAALHKAGREADLRTAFGVDQSQRAALGAARGARNRGDRALLERQAVGEAGFMAQDAARTQALSEVTQAGQIAELRAGEEDADRRFKAELLGKAADLGLNVAALEVDISQADLGSATNWLNNQFDLLKQQGQLDLGYAQLDQQKAESILGFTKDMATLQFEYDKMSVEDQNATDALLMQKYGIDQQTMVALKQIKDARKVNWGQVLTAVIGGVGAGATAAIAKTSDERTKTEIVEVDPGELDELLESVKAETWRYKDDDLFAGDGTRGKRLGPMTQDLKRSRLGRSMVIENPDGYDAVDSGRAGLAALSAVALVHERLKALEA
jgi:hypothetical protein